MSISQSQYDSMYDVQPDQILALQSSPFSCSPSQRLQFTDNSVNDSDQYDPELTPEFEFTSGSLTPLMSTTTEHGLSPPASPLSPLAIEKQNEPEEKQPAAPRKTEKFTLSAAAKPYEPRRLFPEEKTVQNNRIVDADYLDVLGLTEYNNVISRLEDCIVDAFRNEVESRPLQSFRKGPSARTLRKARYALATLYKRLAKTVRRLGFHEHAIVVPNQVRIRSQMEDLPYSPVEEENWRVGDALFETRTEVWYDKEFADENDY
jgi:hypothetical protein